MWAEAEEIGLFISKRNKKERDVVTSVRLWPNIVAETFKGLTKVLIRVLYNKFSTKGEFYENWLGESYLAE